MEPVDGVEADHVFSWAHQASWISDFTEIQEANLICEITSDVSPS